MALPYSGSFSSINNTNSKSSAISGSYQNYQQPPSSEPGSGLDVEVAGERRLGVEQPMYKVKLLEALRSGDPTLIQPFLDEISRTKSNTGGQGDVSEDYDMGAAALHLAIRCASVPTINLLLSHPSPNSAARTISPNSTYPAQSLTTPLHLAATLGRTDVVSLLLDQQGVDDTRKDANGKTCLDVARTREGKTNNEVVKAIMDSRKVLNAQYRGLFHSYVLSPVSGPGPISPTQLYPQSQSPSASLLSLLSSPRAIHINLSYLERDSGTALVHEAAKRRDLALLEAVARAGADVGVKDSRGRTAYDIVGKDGAAGGDRIRVFLKQFANIDANLLTQPQGHQQQRGSLSTSASALPSVPIPVSEPPPTLKGYLNKYTNVAKGYNTRWFVLKNGVLSYYRHQEDETVASRGSISMKTALLKVSEKDKLRFEVHSHSSQSMSGVQKWYMKATHPVEAARWTQAIGRSLDWFGGPYAPIAPARRGTSDSTTPPSRKGNKDGYQSTGTDGESSSLSSSPYLGTGVGGPRGSPSLKSSASSASYNSGHERQTYGGSSISSISTSITGSGAASPFLSGNDSPSSTFRHPNIMVTPSTNRSSISVSRSSLSSSIRNLSGLRKKKKTHRSTDSGPDVSTSDMSDAPDVNASPRLSPRGDSDADDDGDVSEITGISGLPVSARGSHGASGDNVDEDEEEGSSSDSGDRDVMPFADTYELQGNNILAQIELIEGLLASSSTSSVASSSALEPFQTLQTLVRTHLTMASQREDYYAHILSRTRRKYAKAHGAWEMMVREGEGLERELEKRKKKAREERRRSRLVEDGRRGSRMFDDANATLKARVKENVQRTSAVAVTDADIAEEHTVVTPTLLTTPNTKARFATLETLPIMLSTKNRSDTEETLTPTTATTILTPTTPTAGQLAAHTFVSFSSATPTTSSFSPPTLIQGDDAEDMEDDEEDEDEDEFFDAIDSNNIPNLVVPEHLGTVGGSDQSSIVTNTTTRAPSVILSSSSSVSSFKSLSRSFVSSHTSYTNPATSPSPYTPYISPRTSLTLSSERPVTSLWSVLKNSIGKDLTKISFPVYFNEPTSMLQRMAEDMEFSECLDVAAHCPSSLLRLAYVSAFAMSNYSSTIGRIAKPFNPMLGETFEYVSFGSESENGKAGKSGFRYVSEQVSHHPPISACWAEGGRGRDGNNQDGLGRWNYYGEVDAQNKFMGKSFEIRPTGVAHAEVRVPEEWVEAAGGEQDRRGGASVKEGRFVMEHYSWKKVTTNVSGFILGSPTIDHYGDMIVTNHRTKERCILTFKPRGWRGKDAFEIAGQVVDASGNVAYDIAGRWNSQLIARQVAGSGGGVGILNPDTSVASLPSPSSPPPAYILLWRNTPKPAGSPFNLTPFALTLNDCPKDTLKPYLAPTDCRLRPDQRAFELGYYELANDLKGQQEEKQRGVRKRREKGELPEFRPRWFRAETDGDTGERVWNPVRVGDGGEGGRSTGELEYWVERERVWKDIQKQAGQVVSWKGVDTIFIEEPEVIR